MLLVLATATAPRLIADLLERGAGEVGMLGDALAGWQARYLGPWGALLLNGTLFAIGWGCGRTHEWRDGASVACMFARNTPVDGKKVHERGGWFCV